jgi:protein-S-isoprenylcysteine O-methyltransferase Ste14
MTDSTLWTVLIVTVGAIHIAFRLGYLFYIGLALRSAQRLRDADPAIRHARWLVFKKRATVVFTGDVVSTGVFLVVTAGTLPDYVPLQYTIVIGIIFTIVGLATKLAACRAIGTKGFYCYNFFCSDEERKYVARGIYKYLDNPMYGLGYLHAFGFPLLFRSSWGLAFALFDWLIIWVFYFVFERQHTASFWHSEIGLGASGAGSNERSQVLGQR